MTVNELTMRCNRM